MKNIFNKIFMAVSITGSLLFIGSASVFACAMFAFSDYSAINSISETSTVMLMFTGIIGSLFPLMLLPIIRNKYNELRRVFDVALSIISLSMTFPILLIFAILIKLESPGPVFYKQVRVGLNRRKRFGQHARGSNKRADDNFGKPFMIYKLRSMRNDAESRTGAVWARQNDERITRIGKFLRMTHIDEIPQFLNVLRGEMSIIGPRPERLEFVRQLDKNIRYYHRRFQVEPGITGLAQARYHYADSVKDTRNKLKYDLFYAKRKCLIMDTKIIFNTVSTVLLTRGSR